MVKGRVCWAPKFDTLPLYTTVGLSYTTRPNGIIVGLIGLALPWGDCFGGVIYPPFFLIIFLGAAHFRKTCIPAIIRNLTPPFSVKSSLSLARVKEKVFQLNLKDYSWPIKFSNAIKNRKEPHLDLR
jgi:hypothetical protein